MMALIEVADLQSTLKTTRRKQSRRMSMGPLGMKRAAVDVSTHPLLKGFLKGAAWCRVSLLCKPSMLLDMRLQRTVQESQRTQGTAVNHVTSLAVSD